MTQKETSITRTNYFFDGDNKRVSMLSKASCKCPVCACPTCTPCECGSEITTATTYVAKSPNRVSQLAVSAANWTANDTLANSNAASNSE